MYSDAQISQTLDEQICHYVEYSLLVEIHYAQLAGPLKSCWIVAESLSYAATWET